MQGVGAHVVGVVEGHPALEQPRRARRMARVAGEVERRVAVAVHHVDIGSRFQAEVQAEVEAVVGREVQRGIPFVCRACEVGTRLDQQLGAPGEGRSSELAGGVWGVGEFGRWQVTRPCRLGRRPGEGWSHQCRGSLRQA